MPMHAVISDIHANLEALKAVLADIDTTGADEIVCLGDIVGYGPDPEACLDLTAERCSVVLCGNHDYAVLYGARDFNPVAEEAVRFHQELLVPRVGASEQRMKRWDFLRGLRARYEIGDMLYLHGSPRNPIHEYILEADVRWGLERKLREAFDKIERICFIGHTHRPGIITEALDFTAPEALENQRYEVTEGKAIINVGSVGQPRDGNPRACYATVDEEGVTFHRVEYDFAVTQQKINACGRLDTSLGDRLEEGR